MIDEIVNKLKIEQLIANHRAEFKGPETKKKFKTKGQELRNRTIRVHNKKRMMRFVLEKPPAMRLFDVCDYIVCEKPCQT